jgi:cobalamin synthase
VSKQRIAAISAFLAIFAWLGLYFLINSFSPKTSARSLFFPLLFVALTTTFVPVAFYLNHRFARPKGQAVNNWRPIRQSGWAALFLALCTWLQTLRALNWIIAALVLAVFGLIEVFILTRE